MSFLTISFLAVALPYGVESLYFRKRFGFFALIFWIFVIQLTILFGGSWLIENQIGSSLPAWVNAIGTILGAIAFLTIGVTPFVAIAAALISMAFVAPALLKNRRPDRMP